MKDLDEIIKLYGIYNEGLFKIENYCFYFIKGFVLEIKRGIGKLFFCLLLIIGFY